MAKGKHGTSIKLPKDSGVNELYVPPRQNAQQVEVLKRHATAQKMTHDQLRKNKSSGLKP